MCCFVCRLSGQESVRDHKTRTWVRFRGSFMTFVWVISVNYRTTWLILGRTVIWGPRLPGLGSRTIAVYNILYNVDQLSKKWALNYLTPSWIFPSPQVHWEVTRSFSQISILHFIYNWDWQKRGQSFFFCMLSDISKESWGSKHSY